MLAIIPARGGSKGIPRKNLVPLLGKPLVQYTIDAAQESKLISRIILSTEDEEIAQVGSCAGLDMSYSRPVELATDEASMADTVGHCLKWVASKFGEAEDFVLLQPTSPLRLSLDIDNAIKRFKMRGSDWLFSVNEMSEHPYECIEVGVGGGYSFLRQSRKSVSRRQDYEENFYFMNGAIYVYRTKSFMSNRTTQDLKSAEIYVMPRSRGVDVDDVEDLYMAEAILTGSARKV